MLTCLMGPSTCLYWPYSAPHLRSRPCMPASLFLWAGLCCIIEKRFQLSLIAGGPVPEGADAVVQIENTEKVSENPAKVKIVKVCFHISLVKAEIWQLELAHTQNHWGYQALLASPSKSTSLISCSHQCKFSSGKGFPLILGHQYEKCTD